MPKSPQRIVRRLRQFAVNERGQDPVKYAPLTGATGLIGAANSAPPDFT